MVPQRSEVCLILLQCCGVVQRPLLLHGRTHRRTHQPKFLRFSDIAVMHDNGTISIVGRSKDMIVRGGENIYPTEVEQFLFKHPKIEDAHVSLNKRKGIQ